MTTAVTAALLRIVIVFYDSTIIEKTESEILNEQLNFAGKLWKLSQGYH